MNLVKTALIALLVSVLISLFVKVTNLTTIETCTQQDFSSVVLNVNDVILLIAHILSIILIVVLLAILSRNDDNEVVK